MNRNGCFYVFCGNKSGCNFYCANAFAFRLGASFFPDGGDVWQLILGRSVRDSNRPFARKGGGMDFNCLINFSSKMIDFFKNMPHKY